MPLISYFEVGFVRLLLLARHDPHSPLSSLDENIIEYLITHFLYPSLRILQLTIQSLDELHPHINIRSILNETTSYGKYRVLLDQTDGSIITLDLSRIGIQILPDAFGYLYIQKDLWLDYNKLTRLPPTFMNIYVGGCMSLSDNPLTVLPDEIHTIKVMNHLFISNTLVPESQIPSLISRKLRLEGYKL